MRRNLKIIVPIASFIVVIAAFYMIFDIQKKVEQVNYGTNDIDANEVVSFDDEENTVDENEVENESANTALEETNTSKDTNTSTDTNTTNTALKEEVSEEDDSFSKSKLDQAKSLVEKTWGKDDTVYFTNEGMNSDGLYMVAVRDKTSTAVKNYFKVNLETKKVQVDY